MALSPMSISNLLLTVRDTLQDIQKKRWVDEELYRYVDQGLHDIAARTKYNRVVEELTLSEGTDTYTLAHEMIDLYKFNTTQDYNFIDATSFYIEDCKDEDASIEYYAYPPRVTYGVTTSLTLDEDIYGMIRYFVLYRAYEKEDSTELLAKSAYFKQQYLDKIAQNSTRYHGKLDVELSRSDYYN